MKEKLIELLKHDNCPLFMVFGDSIEVLADYLIANGVTVRKWIPVTERLPEIPKNWAEHPDPVLYMMKSTKTIYAGYYGENGTYRDSYFRQYADKYEGVDADDVLCWMWQHDLPEPPKGE